MSARERPPISSSLGLRLAALPSVTGARALVRHAVFAALAVAVGLLLAELAARGYAHVGGEAGRRVSARDPLGVLYEPYGDFGYRQRPGLSERYSNGTRAVWNRMGYRGPVVSVDKPKGTYRIILLGGSTTAGYGVNDDETIDAHMRRLLPGRFPGVCFEVVNLALGGYDSYQDYARMRADGTRLTPDLVIVNSGVNDVRNAHFANLTYPPDPRTLPWEPVMQRMREESKRGPNLWTLTQHYSYLARMLGYVVDLWRQRETLKVMRAARPHGAAVDYFEVNIVRATELALERGAAVILSTPPSALSTRNKPSDPPEKSYWIRDAGTTEEYRRRLGARMKEIAARQRASGRSVSYVSHSLPPEEFLDDAHLTSAGNLTVARNLIETAIPFIQTTFPKAHVGELPCVNLVSLKG